MITYLYFIKKKKIFYLSNQNIIKLQISQKLLNFGQQLGGLNLLDLLHPPPPTRNTSNYQHPCNLYCIFPANFLCLTNTYIFWHSFNRHFSLLQAKPHAIRSQTVVVACVQCSIACGMLRVGRARVRHCRATQATFCCSRCFAVRCTSCAYWGSK